MRVEVGLRRTGATEIVATTSKLDHIRPSRLPPEPAFATMQPRIRVETRYFPPAEPALPALALQITRLVNTCMLWVGTTEVEAENVQKAPLQGSLSKDWACAMPMRDTVSRVTSLV